MRHKKMHYILIYKTDIAVADLGGSEGAEHPPSMPPLEIQKH